MYAVGAVLGLVRTSCCSFQRSREVFVDAATDVAVEVRQQNAAVAEPDGADGRWRRVDGSCGLQRRPLVLVTLCVSNYVHSRRRLDGVSVTALTEIDVVCLTRCC